jgi:hypothetical protein
MTKRRLARLALASGLALTVPFALSGPAHAAAVLPAACAGPTFNSVTPAGFSAASIAWACSDSATGTAYAVGYTNGTAFSGYYYDSNCSGDISGVGSNGQFVGVINNVHCASTPNSIRSGTFSLNTAGLVGTMHVVR